MIWPDTTQDSAPRSDGAEIAAAWLLGRHPRLADLIDRLALADPRLIYTDDGGHPWIELDILADLVAVGAPAFRVLSGGEQTMITTFATLAWNGIPFTATDWNRLDEAGDDFLRDWFDAARSL